MGKSLIHQAPGRAQAKFIWLSPTKARRVARTINHLPVNDVFGMLSHVEHRSSAVIYKVVKSAVANYLQKFSDVTANDLYLQHILIDDGPRVKRIWRRARGRADVLLKRMCHITAVVDTKENIKNYKKPVKSIPNRSTPAVQQQKAPAGAASPEGASASAPGADKKKPAKPSIPASSATPAAAESKKPKTRTNSKDAKAKK